MQSAIDRPQLIRKLQAHLTNGHVLIEAAAGFGKTTLLEQLVKQRPNCYRLQLTIADSDPAVLQCRLTPFLASNNTIILDDVQCLLESDSAEFLRTQLAASHPRWVLAGRRLPFDPVMLLAQGNAAKLEAELAFTDEEIGHLLKNRTALQVQQWNAELAGWPMGIGLLARLQDVELDDAKAHLFDYLASEVYARLSTETQHGLTHTAVFLQFDRQLAQSLLTNALPDLNIDTLLKQAPFLIRDGDSYHYHDLFRTFLIQHLSDPNAVYEQAITLLHASNRWADAVEHALDGGLFQRAFELMVKPDYVWIHAKTRYHTYLRWVRTLPPDLCRQHPDLYWAATHFSSRIMSFSRDADHYGELAIAVAREHGDDEAEFNALLEVIALDLNKHGVTKTIVQRLHQLAEMVQPGWQMEYQLYDQLGKVELALGQFSHARAAKERAVRLIKKTSNIPFMLAQYQFQIAAGCDVPQGNFARAAGQIDQAVALFEGSALQGEQLAALLARCELLTTTARWSQLEQTLQDADRLAIDIDSISFFLQQRLTYYSAILAIARGKFAQAVTLLAAIDSTDPDLTAWVAEAHIWRLVRMGRLEDAASFRLPISVARRPFDHARISLAQDIARFLQATATQKMAFTLSKATAQLITLRARGVTARLRMLLAVMCWHCGDLRWRHHVNCLVKRRTDTYHQSLQLWKDAELSGQFWAICLVEAIAPEFAADALVQLGRMEPLIPLLSHQDGQVRRRTVTVLTRLNDERTMPILLRLISAETNHQLKTTFQSTLTILENSPPPPIHIQLMGGFKLTRQSQKATPVQQERFEEITEFHRPIVLRLLLYFAVNRGVPIPRDRILEDLWADTAPEKAWKTFKSVYSRLRRVLEPNMRSQAPSRYIALEGDAYRFDPLNVVTVDVDRFESAIRDAIVVTVQPKANAEPANGEMMHKLTLTVQQLSNYAQLLPDLPYADWLLEPRQRLSDLYIEGCLHVAQTYLMWGYLPETISWSNRAIDAAPWLEAAYQTLMRAQSRQGNRTLSLKTFETAKKALQAELAIEPSPLTQWLADRLQNGEAI